MQQLPSQSTPKPHQRQCNQIKNNHKLILDDLEHAVIAADTSRSSTSWTLSKDAELCTFLQRFSSHLHDRIAKFSDTLTTLDRTINRVDHSIMNVTLDYLLLSDEQSMEYTRSSSQECASSPTLVSMTKDSSKSIEKKDTSPLVTNIEDEEEAAIERGIQTALTIFYDHPVDGNPHDYVSDHFFGFEDDENEDDENIRRCYDSSCHYYESSPGDIFNQRPLPLVVGSDRFLESGDVGIGGVGSGGQVGNEAGHQQEEEEDVDESQQKDAQSMGLSSVIGIPKIPLMIEEETSSGKDIMIERDVIVMQTQEEVGISLAPDTLTPPLDNLDIGHINDNNNG